MRLSEKVNKKVINKDIGEYKFAMYYDVIVVGLGSSGAIAAITSAKRGLKVLGIEKFNCMGGMATAGSVTGYYFGSEGGIYEELDKKVIKCKEEVYTPIGGFHADAKKYILEQEAVINGVKISYDSVVTSVYLDDKIVKGVQWVSPTGIETAGCGVLIDSTGDAEICDIIGCKTLKGREFDKRLQPFTSVRVFVENGEMGWSNFDCGCTDQTDAEELSNAIITSHAHQLEKSFDEGRQLLYLAPLLGIREGRLIEGEETITLSDFFKGKLSKQPLFYAYADIDKHGRDNAFESELMQDWYVASNLGAINITVPIPLGAMIPKGYGGILAVGRCMAFDHDISTCVRMVRDMQKSGEAAGEAAWIATKNNIALKDIDYNELITVLKETGCYNVLNNRGFQVAYPGNQKEPQSIVWYQDITKIRNELCGDKPGIAIWSSKLLGEKIKEHLEKWIQDKGEDNLNKHSAIALGLMEAEMAVPILREMVRQRDCFVLQDCRKNNQMRGYIAVYLLGKLGDVEIVDELIELICSPEEFNRLLYHDLSFINPKYVADRYYEIYFQFFSHSVRALMRIGDRYDAQRPKIKAALMKAVENEDYIKRITEREPGSYEYSMTENIKTVIENKSILWSDVR